MKQVSFSLFPGQAAKYKLLVNPSIQSKLIRNYILNDYRLPKGLDSINQGDRKGLKPEKFLFDEHADIRLNDLVKTVRESGYKANRSSIMRHLMNELLQKLGGFRRSSSESARNSSFEFLF